MTDVNIDVASTISGKDFLQLLNAFLKILTTIFVYEFYGHHSTAIDEEWLQS